MIYLLDTNAISALMRTDARMASWLSTIGVNDRVVICTIARGEILFGLERLPPGRRRTELEVKAGSCSPYCHVSRSQQPLLIGTRRLRLLNNGAACRWMRTTSGLPRPPSSWTQHSSAATVTSR